MSPRPYRLSLPARRDLSKIRWWIERQSGHDRARAMIERLFEHFNLIAKTPMLGPGRDDLGPNRRIFIVRPYVIAYRPTKPMIEIDRIIHGARDFEAVLRDESNHDRPDQNPQFRHRRPYRPRQIHPRR